MASEQAAGMLSAPVGTCTNCHTMNGEMEDKCKQCGNSLIPIARDSSSDDMDVHEGGRKSKAHGSHGDAPARKTLNATDVGTKAQEGGGTEEKEAGADDIKGMLKQMMSMMKTVQTDVSDIKGDLSEVSKKAEAACATAQEAKAAVSEVQNDVKQLKEDTVTREEVKNMIEAVENKLSASQKATTMNPSCITVVGGLRGLDSSEEAEKWVRRKLTEWSLMAPIDVWSANTDDFTGVISMKFGNPSATDAAIAAFSSKRLKAKDDRVW